MGTKLLYADADHSQEHHRLREGELVSPVKFYFFFSDSNQEELRPQLESDILSNTKFTTEN